MISKHDLAMWIADCPPKCGFCIDEGGLNLCAIGEGVEDGGKHLEIGGGPDVNDWRFEVLNGDTILGFKEWCQHKVDEL